MLPESFLDPFLRSTLIQIRHGPCHCRLKNLAEACARPEEVSDLGVDLSDTLVAHHNPIVRIIEHEPIRDGCDCRRECLALLFTFGSQSIPLREAVAEHRQGPRHGTNLVTAGS